MSRLLLLMSVVALVAVMLVGSATPAFAQPPAAKLLPEQSCDVLRETVFDPDAEDPQQDSDVGPFRITGQDRCAVTLPGHPRWSPPFG